MDEKDVSYSFVSIRSQQQSKNISYTFKNNVNNIDCSIVFNIEYLILEYKDQKTNKPYYQIFVELPFRIKSSWIMNIPKDINDYICKLIESKLNSKYKDIQVRDYNNQLLLKGFNKLVGSGNQHLYSTKYNHGYLFDKINNYPINDIFNHLNSITKIKYFSQIPNSNSLTFPLSWCKFVEMLIKDNCYYCGISISQINELGKKNQLYTKRYRGYCLEIDQKNAYGNYSDSNCVASCYWCNNAKTDEFTEDEFKNIACGINISWNERLQQIGSTSKVIFPWQNQVKCCK